MSKNCENCSLYSLKQGGYCEFWKKEVASNGFCIEYKNNGAEDKKENE